MTGYGSKILELVIAAKMRCSVHDIDEPHGRY